MQQKIAIFAILLLSVAIAVAGCTGTPAQPAATTAPTVAQTTAAPPPDNLVVSPTDVVPDNNQISVIVQEKEYNAMIPVVFDGGKGQYLVKSAQVTLYRSDGQVITVPLGIKKGDLVNLEGTRQTDRVVVYVSEVNGETYKVTDVLSEYRTR
jgi:glucose/arabinose dehydrogenase